MKDFFTKDVPLLTSIFFLALMNENWILSDWTQRGLLAISYGPVYPGVHALSVLSVCMAAGYVGLVQRSAPWAALIGLSIIAVHELVWASLSLIFYGFNQVAGDFYIVAYLGTIIIFALLGRKYSGKMLATLFLSVVYYIFGVIFLTPSLGTANDIAAIVGWAIPCLPWFFVKRS